MTTVTKAPKPGTISDPVYGFIEFSSLERILLDHPVAQRLRNVAQSGLAQYVFPEVRTSRFSHCLGTMHLSSQMLYACLSHCSDKTRDLLSERLRIVVTPPTVKGAVSTPEIASPDKRDKTVLVAFRAGHPMDTDIWQLTEQSIRLAALFHDIGHLPFSHDFEFALRHLDSQTRATLPQHFQDMILRYERDDDPPHEQLGRKLARMLMRDVSSKVKEDVNFGKYGQPLEWVHQTCNFALRIFGSHGI